jgi:V/A-type H+/Na+-transporting ATPase subunit E
MQTKLQELTQKIYQEGINKAKEESQEIISQAQRQAEEILSAARKQADDIVRGAERRSEELSRNSLNELQLTARQAISELKQKVVNMVEAKSISPEAKKAMAQENFTQEVIMTIVKNWSPKDSQSVDLTVLLPEQKQKEFDEFFTRKAKELLDKGLEIQYTGRIKGGFKIGPKNEGYMVSFSDEDFDNFFRSFMRPRLVELLYGQEK